MQGLPQIGDVSIKIITFLITLVVNFIAGVITFFFLLLALNGFSESDANYGIAAYVALAIVVSLLMASGAVLGVVVLLKRKFSGVSAAFISIPVFSVIGAGFKLVCALVGVAVAEYVRVNY